MTKSNTFARKLRNLALAAAVAATSAGALAAPALADDWRHDHDRGGGDWGDHRGGGDRDDWRYRGPYVAAAPGYAYNPYYAYPYGYAYAPTPVYASPGLSIVLPIHIR